LRSTQASAWELLKGRRMKTALVALGIITGLVVGPVASADVPGLDPFVGTWKCSRKTGNTGERLDIDSNGVGVDTWPNVRFSPNGTPGNAPLTTVTYVFTAVVNGVASGSVTDSSDPQSAVVGTPVTAKVVGSEISYEIGDVQRVGLTNDNSGPC
jgi:hypothetical protein